MAVIDTRDFGKIISKNLKRLAFERQKAQVDIARDLNLNKATLSSWMNGTRIPKLSSIDMLCDYFGCTRSDIMEDHEHPRKTISVSDEQAELVQLALKARPENVHLALEILKRLEAHS